MRLLQRLLTLLVVFRLCCCFNIDGTNPYIKQGDASDFFGISVAQHTDGINAWLLVGAPKKDAIKITSNSSSDFGNLYKCPLTKESNDCERVRVSKKLEGSAKSSSFGFSVASQGINGSVLVCSNRWNFVKTKDTLQEQVLSSYYKENKFNTIPKKEQFMSGNCFLLNKTLQKKQELDYNVVSKLLKDGVDDRRHCGIGFTSSFGNNNTLIIGAPGCYEGKGSAILFHVSKQSTVEDYSKKEINYETIRVLKREDLIRESTFDQYLGYSVSISKINPSVVAIGMKRANETGCVVIKDTSKPYRKGEKRICGDQVGASFGASLQLIDINGDGIDDLIVGAPNYFDKDRKTGGAIYVYFGSLTKTVFENYDLVSYGSFRSGFGSIISHIGDINYDGINDLAVAAPMQDFGTGAVYIYNGQRSFSLSPSQVIKGIRLNNLLQPHFDLSSFGYSISGGISLQGNGLVDLTVGSLSGSVFNFRSRPVVNINVTSSTSLNLINLQPIKKASIKNFTSTVVRTSYSMQFFDLNICLNTQTKPKLFNKSLDVFFSVMLDPLNLQRSSRATFSPGNRQRYLKGSVSIDDETSGCCFNKTIYILPDIIDKLSSLKVNITIEKVETSKNLDKQSKKGQDFLDLPILDKISRNEHIVVLNFSKNCGEDNICDSEFSFNASLVERLKNSNTWNHLPKSETSSKKKLIIGSEKEIGIQVETWNKKEDAHQAFIYLQFRKTLKFNQAVSVNNSRDKKYFCNEIFEHDNDTFGLIQCTIGNPFKKGLKNFIVKFKIQESLAKSKNLDVIVWSNTTSKQKNFKIKKYSADILLLSQININGFVRDKYRSVGFSGKVVGQSAIRNASDAGLYLLHEYEVENSGLNSVKDVNIEISWPNQLDNKKWLFYYLKTNLYNSKSAQEVLEGFSCKSTNKTNPLSLQYYENLSHKRYKREMQEIEDLNSTSSLRLLSSLKVFEEQKLKFSCPSYPGCLTITCKIDDIPKESKRTIVISSVVWNSTFIEEYRNIYQSIELVSTANIYVNRSEYIFSTQSNFNASITSLVVNKISLSNKNNSVDYSYIVAAICAGLLILGFVVFIFWKCGFFKRKIATSRGQYHKAQGHQNAAAQYVSKKVNVKHTV